MRRYAKWISYWWGPCDPSKRIVGIQLYRRLGDWWYLEIHLYWCGCMINICRSK